MKQVWDKRRIVRTLRELQARGADLSYNGLARKKQALLSAAAYHFGSYRKAIQRAGMDYALVMRRPRWTKPAIIRLVKQARRSGQDLHWSAVTSRRDELGRAAFAAVQGRLFGSWDRALHAAGLDADEISLYRRWTRSAVVAEMKQRHRDGEALNSGALQRDDPGMHAAALRHYGSYDRALRAAGLEPSRIRQRRRWTREDVIGELKAFHRRHRRVTDSLVRRHAPALYGAALRLFGTVAAGRKAAGIKAPPRRRPER